MRGFRRLGAMAAAGAVAAGLATVAPHSVLAAVDGCGGSFTLASGQSMTCTFAYSGPNAGGTYNDSAFVNVTSGGPAVFAGDLETTGGQVLDSCEGVSLVDTGGCGETHFRTTTPPVPVGTTVVCKVENIGPATLTGTYTCSSGF